MTCPATTREGDWILRCCLKAGHDGDHIADTVEVTDADPS